MKAFDIRVLCRFGFRRILIINGIFTAVSMVFFALLSPATPVVLLLLILFIHGACRSMQFTCMTSLAYTEIPPARMSRANGFLSAIMQLSRVWALRWVRSRCALPREFTGTPPRSPDCKTSAWLSWRWPFSHSARCSTPLDYRTMPEPARADTGTRNSRRLKLRLNVLALARFAVWLLHCEDQQRARSHVVIVSL